MKRTPSGSLSRRAPGVNRHLGWTMLTLLALAAVELAAEQPPGPPEPSTPPAPSAPPATTANQQSSAPAVKPAPEPAKSAAPAAPAVKAAPEPAKPAAPSAPAVKPAAPAAAPAAPAVKSTPAPVKPAAPVSPVVKPATPAATPAAPAMKPATPAVAPTPRAGTSAPQPAPSPSEPPRAPAPVEPPRLGTPEGTPPAGTPAAAPRPHSGQAAERPRETPPPQTGTAQAPATPAEPPSAVGSGSPGGVLPPVLVALPPRVGEPAPTPHEPLEMPRLRQARDPKPHTPEHPQIQPIQPRRHAPPGYFPDWPPCVFVPRHDLICGFGTEARLPTLVLVERTEVSGQDEPSEVIYSIAPGLARIDYPGGMLFLDEIMRQVAYYDAADSSWTSEALADCEARADSIAAWRREHARPARPVFTTQGRTTLIHGYECQPYRATMTVEWPADARREEITQQIWVTRDIETTEEIYATYRHVLRLFDNHWLDVPAERPAGIVFRTREARLLSPRQRGEGTVIEDATLVEVGYRLYPLEFFAPYAAGAAFPGPDDDI